MQLRQKLAELQRKKKGLVQIVDAGIKRVKISLLTLTVMQFSFFYYCIFQVPWLGWDIMEPITYSVEILKFLFALRFFYKYKKDGDLTSFYDVLEERFRYKNPIVGKELRDLDLHIDSIRESLEVINKYDFIQN